MYSLATMQYYDVALSQLGSDAAAKQRHILTTLGLECALLFQRLRDFSSTLCV